MNESTSWHTYPSVYAMGHAAIKELLEDPVLVEEKIDGSQFSFGRFPELRCRSKRIDLNLDNPEKLFLRAVEVVKELPLHIGWTYRAEYLLTPKHNTLKYDRIPQHHLMIFDINTGHEAYLPYDEKAKEAQRLGLEVVPRLYEGRVTSAQQFHEWLRLTSALGGPKIEGVVVKNYHRFGPDRKVLMGKYVSEVFKESHATSWKLRNPQAKDIVAALIDRYRTPARWNKAAQHLREEGRLEGSPRDIRELLIEVKEDLRREESESIRDALFSWAWPKIQRGIVVGLPEWYKQHLLDTQFTHPNEP